MAGQGRAIVEQQVRAGIEPQRRQTRRVDRQRLADRRQRGFGLLRVIGRRLKSGQTQDRGPVRGMADPGEGQRAMQRGAQARRVERAGAQRVQKSRGGAESLASRVAGLYRLGPRHRPRHDLGAGRV